MVFGRLVHNCGKHNGANWTLRAFVFGFMHIHVDKICRYVDKSLFESLLRRTLVLREITKILALLKMLVKILFLNHAYLYSQA